MSEADLRRRLEVVRQKVIDGLTTLEEMLRIMGPAVQYEYNCSKCGKSLDMKFSTCPFCGTVQRRICKKCRAPLATGWVACAYCGEKGAG